MTRRHHAIERATPIAKTLIEDQLDNDPNEDSHNDSIMPEQAQDRSPVEDSDASPIVSPVVGSAPSQDENGFFTDNYDNDQPGSAITSLDQNGVGGFDLSGDDYDTTPSDGGRDALADGGFGGDYGIGNETIGEPDTMSSASLNDPDLNDAGNVDSSSIDPNDYFDDSSSTGMPDDQVWSMDDLSEPDDSNNEFVFDTDDQPAGSSNASKQDHGSDGPGASDDHQNGENHNESNADSGNDQEPPHSDQDTPKWKQGLNSFLRKAKAELHGEDAEDPSDPNDPDEDDDKNDSDSNDTDKNNSDGNGKNSGQKNDGSNGKRNSGRPGLGFHPFKIIGGLLGGVFKLIGITGRLLQSVISIGFILILAWLVLNVVAALQQGSSSNESIDEGTVTVIDRAYHDGSVTATLKNTSDLIAHVEGSAEVKAWSPNLNPIDLVNPRLVATCKIDPVNVNPGESKSITSEQCQVTASGLWNHVKINIEYM
jgi:hypothetical protein